MSMRTIEEEKELDELYFTFTDTSENNEEEIKRENRIKELEQKEENPQYTLIKYDIDGLSLSELQQKCIELSDEYYSLEDEYSELENEYEEYKGSYKYSEEDVSEIKSEYEGRIEELETQITQLEEEVNDKEYTIEANNSAVGTIIIFVVVIFIIYAVANKR